MHYPPPRRPTAHLASAPSDHYICQHARQADRALTVEGLAVREVPPLGHHPRLPVEVRLGERVHHVVCLCGVSRPSATDARTHARAHLVEVLPLARRMREVGVLHLETPDLCENPHVRPVRLAAVYEYPNHEA